MVLVLAGLVFVGLAAFFSGSSGSQAPNPILGDALIIAAQVLLHNMFDFSCHSEHPCVDFFYDGCFLL